MQHVIWAIELEKCVPRFDTAISVFFESHEDVLLGIPSLAALSLVHGIMK
jgi:hypothetical protein